jgi:hypothetical protein
LAGPVCGRYKDERENEQDSFHDNPPSRVM